MKTKTIYLLLVMLVLSLLCGCGNQTGNQPGEQSGDKYPQPTVRVSYDKETRYLPDDENNRLVTGKAEGGFLLKDKKFTYENKNLVLIDVSNETAENYSLKIEVSFLDENGDILKQETQAFGEFASGYQKYFLFDPKIVFHSYVYKLDIELTESDCWRSKFSVQPVGMDVNELMPTELDAKFCVKNASGKNTEVTFKSILIIDSDGEIYSLEKPGRISVLPNEDDYFNINIAHASSKDELSVPTELQNGYQGIAVISGIKEK